MLVERDELARPVLMGHLLGWRGCVTLQDP